MKKIIVLMLISILTFNLVGCGEESIEDNSKMATNQGVEEESIGVDKKLMSVEVTIPSSLLKLDGEEVNIDELTSEAKKDGIKDVNLNDDGSITYLMSKSKHKEMMEEMKEDLTKSMNDIIDDEDFASIRNIIANKNFTEFDIIVVRDSFENSFDGFATMGIALQSMFYQLFDGVDSDDYEAIINIKDEDTGEVIDTVVYPDVFDE